MGYYSLSLCEKKIRICASSKSLVSLYFTVVQEDSRIVYQLDFVLIYLNITRKTSFLLSHIGVLNIDNH